MGEKLKDNWPIIVFTAFISAIFSIGIASAAVKWGKIDDAVSESEFEIFQKEELDRNNKIQAESIKYTDRMMDNHEIKEQLMLNRIENIITLSNEKQDAFLQGQKDLIQSIDSRLKRIEDKTN